MRAIASLAMIALVAVAEPASAQDHSAHNASAPVPEPPAASEQDAHAGHDMGQALPSDDPTMETPPPPEAGSGPPRAADAIWGAEAMRASRQDLQAHHGDFPLFWFQADRAEVQLRDGANGYLWDIQSYYGTPTRRIWFKSEGEGSFGADIEDAEIQALYSRAITPFFDVQAGVRQDVAGADTTYGVLGIQGMAPYMFEVDAALFLSHRGDITARVEAEVDQRITQALILQPRAEVSFAAQDIQQSGIGAGIDKIELGVRLRYEIIKEFAPYIGIEHSWRVGDSARFARIAGEDSRVTSFVAGIRFWF